jgi:hypothetical protein
MRIYTRPRALGKLKWSKVFPLLSTYTAKQKTHVLWVWSWNYPWLFEDAEKL